MQRVPNLYTALVGHVGPARHPVRQSVVLRDLHSAAFALGYTLNPLSTSKTHPPTRIRVLIVNEHALSVSRPS